MSDSKPESASGYSLEVTEACEQALVTVLGWTGAQVSHPGEPA